MSPKENNYKSIFLLHVYATSSFGKKLAYCIDQADIGMRGRTNPGFQIYEREIVYCTTLADAEKRIKRYAKRKREDLYGFVVEEKPLDCACSGSDRLSVRRYLKNGKLWQKCEVSTVRYFFGAEKTLGETGFYGREPETVPFKEGDIVEVVWGNLVHLAIVWNQPPSVEQMKIVWNRFQAQSRWKKESFLADIPPDEDDDSYVVVDYWMTKEGKICPGHSHPATVNVLPPSLPVPRKIAAELRRMLKMSQKRKKEIDLKKNS